MSNNRTCSRCKEKKDYGIWITATDQPVLFCLECYIKKCKEAEKVAKPEINEIE